MMTESQDVAVDLSGHTEDQKVDLKARPSATSEIPLDEDSDESVDELDMARQERANVPMWSFEYYQGFFDVDTDQVVHRLVSSFIPRHNFVRLIRPNPDLYGPFWVCITLALSFTIFGNLTGYLQAAGKDYQWTYNFRHLTFAATAIYSYVWLLPAVLWAWMWWRGMKVYSLFEITCVYGYSLSVFLPCSIIWILPNAAVRWTVFMIGMVLSGSVLFRTFWPMLKKHDKKLALITIGLILACHAALSVGFVLYFYSSASGSSTVAKPLAVSTPAVKATTTAQSLTRKSAFSAPPAMLHGKKHASNPIQNRTGSSKNVKSLKVLNNRPPEGSKTSQQQTTS